MTNKYELAWVTKGEMEYSIIRDVFLTEGNTGWTYETLDSGFKNEEEAEEFLLKMKN